MKLWGIYEADKNTILVEYCAGDIRYRVPEKYRGMFVQGQQLQFEPFTRPEIFPFRVFARKVEPWPTLAH